MLNWLLISVLIFVTIAGFQGLDAWCVKVILRLRKKIHKRYGRLLEVLSFTPSVVVVLYVLPLLYFVFRRDWYTAATLTAACGLSLGLAFFGKYVFARVRPFGHTTYLGKVDSAFPSAHTAGSFAAAFCLAIFWPDFALVFFLLATAVAASRMYLQLHYFSDVAAGIVVAYLMSQLVLGSGILAFFGFS